MQLYCNSLTEYSRLKTLEVTVGDLFSNFSVWAGRPWYMIDRGLSVWIPAYDKLSVCLLANGVDSLIFARIFSNEILSFKLQVCKSSCASPCQPLRLLGAINWARGLLLVW